MKKFVLAFGVLGLLFAAGARAEAGFSCGPCAFVENQYFYNIYFQGAYYGRGPDIHQLGSALTEGVCLADRASDPRCQEAPMPQPVPQPIPQPVGDACGYYSHLGMEACIGHAGCDWSVEARTCFIMHNQACSYYTPFGFQACIESSQACDWSTEARECFQR